MSSERIPIPGYPEYTIDRSGSVKLNGEDKPARISTEGWFCINLKNPTTGKYDPKRIKDLVAKVYLPNDDPLKKYLGFKDRDRKNHHLDNLIWMTEKEKAAHNAKPPDTSDTRSCRTCQEILPITNFPLDHADPETGEGNRRHSCQKCISASKPPPTPAQQEKRRRKWLKDTYNLTLEEYNEMLHAQGRKCATCSVDISGKMCAHVDHCHATNKVRGLLCPNCNKALGMVGDSIDILQALALYLQTHGAVPGAVKMPSVSPRVNPPKKGGEHGNTGKERSAATRAEISATKRKDGSKKFEEAFKSKLEWWVSDPTGDKQKVWRHSISRKYRDGNLPPSCISVLEMTRGWTYSKGTPHTTDSRVQNVMANDDIAS